MGWAYRGINVCEGECERRNRNVEWGIWPGEEVSRFEGTRWGIEGYGGGSVCLSIGDRKKKRECDRFRGFRGAGGDGVRAFVGRKGGLEDEGEVTRPTILRFSKI